MSIQQHISNLLYNHDCVIVPGFGGFVSNYQPAQVHPVHHSFKPPAKRILFNSELKSNDGLLANELMSLASISYQEAIQLIGDTVSTWKRSLKEGKTIDLEKTGKLFADKEGNIQFEQDSTINFLNDSFGMTSFVSPAIRRTYKVARPQPRPGFSGQPKKSNTRNLSINFAKLAAAIAVLAMISVVGYNMLNNPQHWASESSMLSSFDTMLESSNSEDISTSNNNFENVAILSSETLMPASEAGKPATSEAFESEAALPKRDIPSKTLELVNSNESLEAAIEIPSQTPAPPTQEPQPARRMYHLIAGSFSNAANASSLIEIYQSKGYQTMLIGPAANGFYRVSIMACLRKSDALVELKKMREDINPNIWLLRQ